MNSNNLIVPAAALVALVGIFATVLIARPDQAGLLAPVIGVLVLSLMAVIRGEKVAEMTAIKTEELHKVVNSRMDELLKLTKDAALAKGDAQGRTDLKAEQAMGVLEVPAKISVKSVEVRADTVQVTPNEKPNP